MTSSEMNPLYQQMGELLGSMKALHDKVDFRHAQAEKQSEAVQAEIRNVKHDQRDLEQKFDGAVYVVKNDVDALRAASGVASRALDELTIAVSFGHGQWVCCSLSAQSGVFSCISSTHFIIG